MKIILTLTTVLFLTTSAFVQAANKQEPAALNQEYMVVGDFDNDGLANDLVLFNENNITFLRSINNEFQVEPSNFTLPSDLSDFSLLNEKIVAGDFDHDGFMDDLAGIYSIGVDKTSFTVWINNNGQFSPSQWWYGGDFNADMVTNTLVSGDFDRDGFIDDVVGFYNYDETHTKAFVWKSDGKKFGWPGTWWIGGDFDATRIQSTLVTGDFDHDGFMDDIAGLYNYASNRCKIFVWESQTNRFEWPYTWYNKDNFKVENIKGSVVAGDFNNNGYKDDIAALYRVDELSTKIIVWQLNGRGFNEPETWWYGAEEGTTTRDRIITIDANNNLANDQISGLSVNENESTWLTWTAINHSFTLPETQTFENKLLGINKNKDNNISKTSNLSISVYPNPASDFCFVTIPDCRKDATLEIFNMTGSVVYQTAGQPGSTLQINLQDLAPGTYMIRVINDELDLKQSIIKE